MAENLNEGKSKKELYDEQKALKAAQKEKELKKQLKAEEKKNRCAGICKAFEKNGDLRTKTKAESI